MSFLKPMGQNAPRAALHITLAPSAKLPRLFQRRPSQLPGLWPGIISASTSRCFCSHQSPAHIHFQSLRERLKPDLFLQERQLRLTPKSRLDFLRAAGHAHMDACRRLGRMAHGDYGPDAAERHFPTEPFTRKPEAGSVDIWALFDAYALERKPTPKTLSGYRFSIGQFVESVGHTDARRFTRADVLRWKDAMVAANVPAKTINDARLAHLKAVLNYAVNNERLPSNPASKVSAGGRGNKDARKMLGYGDHEATTILTAAVADARPVIRWVPLLCAMHGARVAEMMQLRREDVFLDGGVWSIRITEDAGGLKNKASERIIPLHPCLVQRGFLAFVSEQSKGPLFYNEARRRRTLRRNRARGRPTTFASSFMPSPRAQDCKSGESIGKTRTTLGVIVL